MLCLAIFTLLFFNAMYWQLRFKTLLVGAGILRRKYIGLSKFEYWLESIKGTYSNKNVNLKKVAILEIASKMLWFVFGVLYAIWGMNQ